LCINCLPSRLRAVKKSLKTLGLVFSCILLVAAALGAEILRFGGIFTDVAPAFDGACHGVELGGSSEDIQIDRRRGIAYLSMLDRDSLREGQSVNGSANGTIMLLDLNLAEPAPRGAMTFDPPGFRPHGFSVLEQPGQPARLFAISHPADGSEVVEIAEQDSSGFSPKTTVRDPAFTHPNAIVAVGVNQFYLVNDRKTPGFWERLRGALFRSGEGTLVFHDGKAARVLVRDLAYPAGLASSPDGTKLYVPEVLARSLRVYARNPADNSLRLEETLALGKAPDNVNVDEDGVVWIATHPKLLSFISHARDSANRAPTQVLRFDPRETNRASRLTQVYLDDGRQISAGTVAAGWRGQFLIGALLDKKVLICKPNP
jgi:arylesterase/paraoxonase